MGCDRDTLACRIAPGKEAGRTMAIMMSTGTDVVNFLKEQHEQIRSLFNQVTTTSGNERQECFNALRRLLAVHETAEEEIVHPVARRKLADGDSIVGARLREEHEMKSMLAGIESIDVNSPEFETKLSMLRSSVLAHAEAEERDEFVRLGAVLDQSQLERMARAAKFAEAIAPTRAHPGVESATKNILTGPFLSMIDRVRDAL